MRTKPKTTMSDEEKTLAKYNYCASKAKRYQYTGVLGKGRFGIVLKAWDAKAKKFVAVKIMAYKGIFIKNSNQQKTEVDIQTRLKHENIVRIKDNFEYREWILASGIAIVMELCPYGSLSEVLKEMISRKRTISEEKRFVWYMQLMSALVHIHGKNIVHGDVKPENILVDARGVLKVGDVGVSKVPYTEGSLLECSSSLYMQTLAGTYPFMAPEVFDNHYSVKSDIFSMGLVMFVMCELPQNLIPIVKKNRIKGEFMIVLQSKRILPGLGLFYHCQGEVRATEALLTRKSLPKEEGEIFDGMLDPNSHYRLDSSQVLCKLNEVLRMKEEMKLLREKEKRRSLRLQDNSSEECFVKWIFLFIALCFAFYLIHESFWLYV